MTAPTTTPAEAAEMTVSLLAEERTVILDLANTPHLTDQGFDTIAPYVVWITYRKHVGETDHTWRAEVSGNRVVGGEVTIDATTITLRSDGYWHDDVPEWLAKPIADHTPDW